MRKVGFKLTPISIHPRVSTLVVGGLLGLGVATSHGQAGDLPTSNGADLFDRVLLEADHSDGEVQQTGHRKVRRPAYCPPCAPPLQVCPPGESAMPPATRSDDVTRLPNTNRARTVFASRTTDTNLADDSADATAGHAIACRPAEYTTTKSRVLAGRARRSHASSGGAAIDLGSCCNQLCTGLILWRWPRRRNVARQPQRACHDR